MYPCRLDQCVLTNSFGKVKEVQEGLLSVLEVNCQDGELFNPGDQSIGILNLSKIKTMPLLKMSLDQIELFDDQQ